MRNSHWNSKSNERLFESRLRHIAAGGARLKLPWQVLDAPFDAATVNPSIGVAVFDEVSWDFDAARRQRIDTCDGAIWIEGSSILCACPDCAAPLSLKLDLAMGQCWRCPAAVELTTAQRLAAAEAIRRSSGLDHPAVGRIEETTGHRRSVLGPFAEPARRHPTEYQAGPRRARHALRDRLQATPAWLVSLLLHIILLLILALVLLPRELIDEAITITTFVRSLDQPGGVASPHDLERPLSDDLLPAPLLEMGEAELRHFKQQADQDARELLVDDAPLARLPDVAAVRQNLTRQTGQTKALLARDPRVRAEIVTREGGSTLTEACVSRGLRWLASVQNQDGSWSLTRYERSDRADNRGDVAGTSLALLPFLGAGQTHEFGAYKSTVARGLHWLVERQKTNGDLRDSQSQEFGMYAHGQAAIVLIEAYAMTGDQKLRDGAQRAIRFIEDAQHERGGWRYQPGQAGDTSVFGWQLMALQSARASGSGLQVDEATLKLADQFLDSVSRRTSPSEVAELKERFRQPGVLYRYQADRQPTPAMTAEAILCRMYLGWQRDDPRLASAIEWLTRYHLPESDEEFNVYYWYYGAQALHHYGGTRWTDWNRSVRDLLVLTQETDGEHPGSWNPELDVWGQRSGGRIYVTSLAVCTLEVYYRHLPLFKQLDLN